ncbi:BTAD domain-containing putative transcriptional regulator [Smaragdicoccus niigatensis]|uniref:BTAD domain-containing putative transcriptional regulator n=1 Tax=Smaragdicoccus niigatensis TaxID=359359 RepID=UPI00036DF943|nr:BTAD domain-containing putative transcriptional regulator [Smaragdicoccus niigatensis]
MPEAGVIEIRLLGRFAALRDGVEIPVAAFEGRKVRTLVKVLASRQGRFVSNDVLAGALWPDRLPEDPAANLQVLVNRARRALGDPKLILTGQRGYTLAGSPACEVDAERFAVAAADESSAPRLREALSLWSGEPLPEEAYDDWAAEYRARMIRIHQHLLERTASLALDEGDADTAVEMSSRAVAAEPLREVAVLLLVKALAAAGDGSAALTAYLDFRTALADELGVDPSPAAASIYEGLLRELPARTESSRRSRASQLGELAFVGRTDELRYLRSALTSSTRRGAVVTVSGVSGSGKSRLVDRLAREVPLIRVRAYLSDRADQWSMLRTLLREALALDIGFLDALPTPMQSSLAWLLPELGRSAGVEPDPASRHILVQEAAVRVLEATEMVIAIDDLQWCDPSSLAIVETVVNRAQVRGTILIFRPAEAADRDDVTALLAHCATAVRVNLGGLSADALRELVNDVGVVEAITQHTDRTPMAVAEVLQVLAAEGLVLHGPAGHLNGATPAAAARATQIAQAGKRMAIANRVNTQIPADRKVLSLLALRSRETSVPLISAASGTDHNAVHASLSRLFRRGLVRLGDLGWATSHDMVTEVVGSLLDAVDSARLHADLAEALRTEDDVTAVAHHLREAGDARGAAEAYADAAARALLSYADDEAIQLAQSGLALQPSPFVRASLHETRGQARQRRSEITGAREDIRAALAASTNGPARARNLSRLAMLASGADDIVRAASLAELAVAEAGTDHAARARALEVASILDMNNQRADRAVERAAEALALYEQLSDGAGMARVLDARAMAQFLDGAVTEGEAALRRAADLFYDSGDLVRVLTPRSTAGHALVFAGRAADGLVQINAALELARTLGNLEGQSYALWHLAEAFAALSRGDEALAAAMEALDIATRIEHRGWTATAWRGVGIAHQQLGDLDSSLNAFFTSLDLSEHLGLFASWAAARAAIVLVRRGALDQAHTLAERALREGPALGHYEARWAQTEVAAALGDPRAAHFARNALERMASGGMEQGRERLTELANPPASA